MELTLDQALQKGIEAHKAGQFQEADRYYTAILKANPNHPDANHNMGVLAAGVGKVEQALPFFKTALEVNPSIAQFWLSYIDALIKLDRMDDAKTAFEQAKSKGLQGNGFDKLEKRLGSSDTKKPNDQSVPQEKLDSLMLLYNQNRLQQVFNEAQRLTKRYTKSLTLWNLIGISAAQIGNLDDAVSAFQKTISIKPDFAEAYYNMGITLRDQGKLDEAIEAYNKALSIKEDFIDAYNNKGNALKDQGKLDEAIEAYTKALTIKPDYAQSWFGGADALEKYNKLYWLEKWLQKASQAFETVPADLNFMKSKLLWRNGMFKKTASLLSSIDFDDISAEQKRDYLTLKAKCYEKFNNFDAAYDCFVRSNFLAKEDRKYLQSNSENYFQFLRRQLSKLKSKPLAKSKVRPKYSHGFTPTFLIGFPRSGTTLLDSILRSHSRIYIIEEKPLVRTTEHFLNKNGHYDFAGELIPPHLNLEAQKIYTREFSKHTDTILADKVCIDKLPLNLLSAPLIHQLYPDAKFILALRHPMDSILSCWMQDFHLNAAMANMVDLDRVVEFYCIAMETFKICRKNYNLNVFEIRYEDLVNNFQKESEAVLQFLNLGWEPKMQNYQDTALKRGRINTPSYAQVVQPIYKDAQYRWLNYQKHLEQYLAQVKPWISEFGYD